MAIHPLKTLSVEETRTARDVVLSSHPNVVVDFREIYLQEPEKELMKQYLNPGLPLSSNYYELL
jgi:primary-amine oxidase